MGLFQNLSTRPDIYLDVFMTSISVGSKIRITPIEGQQFQHCFVECSKKQRACYPIGSIFKADCRVVRPRNRKPYLTTLKRNGFKLALEFYEHNHTLLTKQISI